MSSGFEIRTNHFFKNPLLLRQQMQLVVTHPGKPNVSKLRLREALAAKYNVRQPETIVLYGFRTDFGGGRSTGSACIYNSVDAMKKVEIPFRLVRMGVMAKKEKKSRKSIKELKNRKKKVKGKKKAEIGVVKK